MEKMQNKIIDEPKQETVDEIADKLINVINKAYQVPVMSRGSSLRLNKIPSGIFSIDYESDGGLARGRGYILVGNESCFKSTLLYSIAGNFQRICGNCLKGKITEINFKKCEVPVDADNINIKKGANGNISMKYFADGLYRNVYSPGEKTTHKSKLNLFEYELECDVCNSPQYSLFLLVDAEHNYTKIWARKWGVIHHYTILATVSNSQQTGEIIRESLNTGRVSIVGVDSVDSSGPKEEEEASFSDWQMGLQARVWNKITRSIHGLLNKFFVYTYTDKNGNKVGDTMQPEPAVVLIQQYREGMQSYGDPRVIGGGRGKKYMSSLTIDLSVGEKDWREKGSKPEDKDLRGIFYNFGFLKSKISKPYRYGRFFFNLDTLSVMNSISVIEYGVKLGIVEKKGAWFIFSDYKFQGIAKFANFLHSNTEVFEKLKNMVMHHDKET